MANQLPSHPTDAAFNISHTPAIVSYYSYQFGTEAMGTETRMKDGKVFTMHKAMPRDILFYRPRVDSDDR